MGAGQAEPGHSELGHARGSHYTCSLFNGQGDLKQQGSKLEPKPGNTGPLLFCSYLNPAVPLRAASMG